MTVPIHDSNCIFVNFSIEVETINMFCSVAVRSKKDHNKALRSTQAEYEAVCNMRRGFTLYVCKRLLYHLFHVYKQKVTCFIEILLISDVLIEVVIIILVFCRHMLLLWSNQPLHKGTGHLNGSVEGWYLVLLTVHAVEMFVV